MRVTKVMLEKENEHLRSIIESSAREKALLQERVKLLNGVIATYSKMPALIIATERISDALAHTVDTVSRLRK